MNVKRNRDGQAMVELTVSLVGILAVFCGFLLISKLSIQNVDNIIEAREESDDNAINSIIANPGYSILSWGKGSDNYMYTADDTRITGVFADPALFSEELQNDIFSLKSDLLMNYINENFAPNVGNPGFIFLTAANLTSGDSSSSVELDDLEQFFYVDTASITLKDEIYMPFTSEN
ncbi:MAG: hypothetical protein WCS96_03305 [Victivallales bacterium]|jgi:hypothetical protein